MEKNTTSIIMKQYITEALILLMNEKPYSKISISDIAKKAGVNRSTYYRHFYTKEEVITFYLKGIMQEYIDKYKKNGNFDKKNYFCIMFSVFYSHRLALLKIHKEKLSYLLIEVLNEFFDFSELENIKQFSTAYHIGGIYNNLLLWFSHEMKETPKEMTDIALSTDIVSKASLFNSF